MQKTPIPGVTIRYPEALSVTITATASTMAPVLRAPFLARVPFAQVALPGGYAVGRCCTCVVYATLLLSEYAFWLMGGPPPRLRAREPLLGGANCTENFATVGNRPKTRDQAPCPRREVVLQSQHNDARFLLYG